MTEERRAWLVFLALCTPHTDAANPACDDKTTANSCIAAYSDIAASTDVAARCTGIQTYVSCIEAWVGICNNVLVTDPYVANLNSAKKFGCDSVCKTTEVCGGAAADDSTGVPVTVTVTPWDSSASSLAGNTFSASSFSKSLNQGSSASDMSNSAGSFKSFASGSSGFYLPIWQWLIVLSGCFAGAFAAPWMMRKPRRKQNKAPSSRTDLVRETEALPIFEPLQPMIQTNKQTAFSVVPTPQYTPSQANQQHQQVPLQSGHNVPFSGYGFAAASPGMVAPMSGYAPASSSGMWPQAMQAMQAPPVYVFADPPKA